MAGPLDFILNLFGGPAQAQSPGGYGDYSAEMESPASPGELPWQNPTTGAPTYQAGPQNGPDPNAAMYPGAQQAAASPYQGRTAAQSGTIMGFLDHIMGVPTAQDVNRRTDIYNKQQELDRTRNQNSASATILDKLNDINDKNPKLPPHQRFQMLMQSPEFRKSLMDHGPEEMMPFVKQLFEGLEINPEQAGKRYQSFAPGHDVFDLQQIDPATGKPKLIHTVPKLPGADGMKNAELVTQGEPRAAQLGIQGLKPGERVEVKTQKLPDGTSAVTDLSFPDRQNMDLARVTAIQESKPLIKRSYDIRDQQASTILAAQTADNVIRALEDPKKGGALQLGPAATAVRIGEALLEQGRAVAREMGVAFEPQEFSKQIGKIIKDGKLTVNAANATAVQSNLTALAYTIAKAHNGSLVTKADVADAMNELGGNMGSTAQTIIGITTSLQRAINKQDSQLEVYRSAFDQAAANGIPVTVPERMEVLLAKQGLTRFTGQIKDTRTKIEEPKIPKKPKNFEVDDGNGNILYYDGVGDMKDARSYSKTPVK